MAVPTIVSGVITNNNYMLVTFSEGVYTTSAHTTPITAADFTAAITTGTGTLTGITISSITKADGTALTATGGDSVVRMVFNTTPSSAIVNGSETIKITVASGAAVYNVTAEAMAAGQNTGFISTIALLTIYVSKAGNDLNDGLTPATAKLTLGGAKIIHQIGYNKIWIGIGDYIEVVSWNNTTPLRTVELWGDYNGVIFSSAVGEVICTQSTAFNNPTAISINRLTLKASAASITMCTWGIESGKTKEHNYVKFQCHATGDNLFTSTNVLSGAYIVFNNCTQTIGPLNMTASSSTEYVRDAILEFNNWDNITGAVALQFLYLGAKRMLFNNCSIILFLITSNCSMCDMRFIGGTIKLKDVNSSILVSGIGSQPIVGIGNVIFKDCVFQDYTGAVLNTDTNVKVNFVPYSLTSKYIITNLASNKLNSHILLDNINSNGKKILLLPLGVVLDGDTETYNSKDVLYYHGTTETNRMISTIPLEGLVASTEYDITFSYKKSKNSSSASYNCRFAVVNAFNLNSDVITTPANALTYADYLSSAHTYDTWYDKTLTFTTTSDPYETYALYIYPGAFEYNFKITQPGII